ncbi:hypothetical protein GCM10007389_27680 [Pontibacter akesuensis]|nr:hypothetical protein GCM10007389_27680 [Pontibacter akesuensis]
MPTTIDIILSSIGKQYLYLRLRSQERVVRELELKYEGKYKNAGLSLLFDLLMALAVVVVVSVVAAILYFFVS